MAGKLWTWDEEQILRSMFANNKTSLIANLLNRSYGSTAQHANVLGLKKSEGFLASEMSGRLNVVGKAHRFKKGFKPWNKGKSYHAGGRSRETQFKKGLPFKGKDIYTYRDKNGKDYKFVRTAPGVRQPLHRVLWETYNGKIPSGFIVAFRDGNTMNCKIGNLALISKADNMKRNTAIRFPPELRRTMRVLKKLKRKIHEKQN
jgi:hypothetical protein